MRIRSETGAHRSPVTASVIALATAACVGQSAPGIRTDVPGIDARRAYAEPAITAEDLRRHVFVIAADSMEGRAAGSPGALRAQRYIEAELRRLGVTPAGEAGGYAQPIRMVRRRVGPSTLATASGTRFEPWRDFVPLPWPWRPRPIDGAAVVYAGDLGATTLDPAAVAGKLVIVRGPGGRPVMPRVAPGDPLGRAAGVAVVGLETFTPERLAPVRRGLDAGLIGGGALQLTAPVSMVISSAVAEALLGKPLADARVGDSGPPVGGSVTFADSTTLLCCNVIGVIRGSDPARAGQYVALGAHLDHTGTAPAAVDHDSARAASLAHWDARGKRSGGDTPADAAGIRVDVDSLRRTRPARRDSIFNGADDDGSGTGALLEIAGMLASRPAKPRRSVLLVWHTAEELGNQGSTWFTDNPTVPLDSIVAQLNVDMIGRGAASDVPGGGPAYLQVIGSRRLSRQLGDLIERVNAESTAPFTLDYQYDSPSDPRRLYCRSDHASYARHGIPIAFFTTGEHADYHRVTDEPQYIDYPHLAAVTRFVAEVVARLGDLSDRPMLDGPKPDPRAGCRG